MGIKWLSMIGVCLVSIWFLYNGYLLINDSKHYGEEYYRAYVKLHTYYETNLDRKIRKMVSFVRIPDPEIFNNHKAKIPKIISYAYFLCPLSMLLGLNFMAYPLAVLHLFYAALFDNPVLTANTAEYDAKKRALMFDACLIATLFVVAGAKLYRKDKKK